MSKKGVIHHYLFLYTNQLWLATVAATPLYRFESFAVAA